MGNGTGPFLFEVGSALFCDDIPSFRESVEELILGHTLPENTFVCYLAEGCYCCFEGDETSVHSYFEGGRQGETYDFFSDMVTVFLDQILQYKKEQPGYYSLD